MNLSCVYNITLINIPTSISRTMQNFDSWWVRLSWQHCSLRSYLFRFSYTTLHYPSYARINAITHPSSERLPPPPLLRRFVAAAVLSKNKKRDLIIKSAITIKHKPQQQHRAVPPWAPFA